MIPDTLLPGQVAYDAYVDALELHRLCAFRDLAVEMQRVWACVEIACQGRHLLPFEPAQKSLAAANHHREEHQP